MYENGFILLLYRFFIRFYVIKVFCNFRVRVCINEYVLVFEFEFDKEMYIEIWYYIVLDLCGYNECIKYICNVE